MHINYRTVVDAILDRSECADVHPCRGGTRIAFWMPSRLEITDRLSGTHAPQTILYLPDRADRSPLITNGFVRMECGNVVLWGRNRSHEIPITATAPEELIMDAIPRAFRSLNARIPEHTHYADVLTTMGVAGFRKNHITRIRTLVDSDLGMQGVNSERIKHTLLSVFGGGPSPLIGSRIELMVAATEIATHFASLDTSRMLLHHVNVMMHDSRTKVDSKVVTRPIPNYYFQ